MMDHNATEPQASIQRIADLLAEIESPGSFAARRRLPMEAMSLEVRGVGNIRLPVSARTARSLQSVSHPARHGYREQTLLDKSVRDTSEVSKSRIKLDRRQWNAALKPELDRIRHELGFPEGCKLKAELHNLLVYSKGQFFRTHQDSEKCDDMVGTLVVTLPSKVKGGQLVVRHHDQEKRFRSSTDALALVAFYADCHHEVLPVTEGFRVALTFNLTATHSDPPEATKPSGPKLDALATATKAYFESPKSKAWRRGAPDLRPEQMAYLLDHEYTQRALGWNRLKNGDALRAAWLREVAETLDCEIVLTQAEVHETWQCEEEPSRGRYSSRWADSYDEDEDKNPDDFPDLINIIDTSIQLSHFLDTRGKKMPGSTHITTDEICFTKPSLELDPFRSEHEGFMGNWGNTVDRWYHRAAIVLWPRSKSFVLQAKASASWAIRTINRTLKAGQSETAHQMVRELTPFWNFKARENINTTFLKSLLNTATALKDQELATQLLTPFHPHDLSPSLALPLINLTNAYDITWFRSTFSQTTPKNIRPDETERLKWTGTLPKLTTNLLDTNPSLGHDIATSILTPQAVWLIKHCQIHTSPGFCTNESPLDQTGPSILSLIESAVLLKDDTTHHNILKLLKSPNFPPVPLSHFLQSARKSYPRSALSKLQIHTIVTHCINDLEQRLQRPPRSPDDWSIDSHLSCNCTTCSQFTTFLRDPDQRHRRWPLNKALRRHIHNTISTHQLPIDHTTRRTGRPFTLILTKTPALFHQSTALRSAQKKSLTWLTRNQQAFAPPRNQQAKPIPN